jgi:hypothetical protein
MSEKIPLVGPTFVSLSLSVLLTSAPCLANSPTAEATVQTARRPAARDWLKRPWEWRYLLLISDHWSSAVRVSAGRKSEEDANSQKSRTLARAFEPSATIASPEYPAIDEPFSIVLIEFDKEGFVTTPNRESAPLRGRISRLQSIVLSMGDQPHSPRYPIAFWFTGLGDVSTHWAPAICVSNQTPDAAQVRSDGYLYGRLFKPHAQSTTFGCREWAYQLYDPERPYIDVTSYVPKDEYFPEGSYVREFIGWARFGDKKPVIGKHGKTWLCFHDCPGGDKPGAISDIKAWAARNGWDVPKPPTKAPTFPDPPATSGKYP